MGTTADSIGIKLPHLYDKQAAAIMSDERYAVIEASPKAGKTVGCIVWLINEAAKVGGHNHHFWWVAPVYSQTDIAFRRIKAMFKRADPEKRFWDSNEAKMTFMLPDESTIWFKSGDKPDTLYGEDVYGAVIDEGVRVKEASWHAVRSTLTATEGRCRIISNVRGRRNWVWPLARKAEAGEKNWSFAKLTAYDAAAAGVITYDEIEDAKAVLPPHVFKELYMAEAAEDEGNPFDLRAIRECTVDDEEWRGEGPIVAWGVDLAKYQDWTVAVGLNEDGDVVGFSRWQSDWRNTVHRLRAMIKDVPAIIDMTGVGDMPVEEMQRMAPNIQGLRFSAQNKQELMVGLASAIQRRSIRFPKGAILNELEAFEYAVRTTPEGMVTGVSYKAAAGNHDDCVDALALSVKCLGSAAGQPLEVRLLAPDLDEWDEEAHHWHTH